MLCIFQTFIICLFCCCCIIYLTYYCRVFTVLRHGSQATSEGNTSLNWLKLRPELETDLDSSQVILSFDFKNKKSILEFGKNKMRYKILKVGLKQDTYSNLHIQKGLQFLLTHFWVLSQVAHWLKEAVFLTTKVAKYTTKFHYLPELVTF